MVPGPAQVAQPHIDQTAQLIDIIAQRAPLLILVIFLFAAAVALVTLRDWFTDRQNQKRQDWLDERDRRIREDERNAKR